MQAAWARHKKRRSSSCLLRRGCSASAAPGKLNPSTSKTSPVPSRCAPNPKTIGEIYPIGGPDELTWPQMHARRRSDHRRKPLVIPLPAWYAKMLAAIVPSALLPFNRIRSS